MDHCTARDMLRITDKSRLKAGSEVNVRGEYAVSRSLVRFICSCPSSSHRNASLIPCKIAQSAKTSHDDAQMIKAINLAQAKLKSTFPSIFRPSLCGQSGLQRYTT